MGSLVSFEVCFHFSHESNNVSHPSLRITSNFGLAVADYWWDRRLNSLTSCCEALRGLGERRGGLCKDCGRVIMGEPYLETRYDEGQFRPWLDAASVDPLTAELIADELATRHQRFVAATFRVDTDYDLAILCSRMSGPVT